MKESPLFTGRMQITKTKDGKVVSVSPWMKNRIVCSDTHGRNLIIRALKGDTTYGLEIDSAEIGTGNTAPADGNTALVTPILTGVDIANAEITDVDELTLTIFMSDAQLANGTYQEFGLRIGAQLFSRILISPSYTKSTGEDSTFTYVITLNAS